MDEIPSKYLQEAIEQLSSLPSVGKKTAARLVLSMMKWPKGQVSSFAQAFIDLENNIKTCQSCYAYADESICEICKNPLRNEKEICIIENISDQMALENTGIFKGKYHVLGGLIAPIDGVGPADIQIESLIKRVSDNPPEEIIFALNSSIEGEATSFYIHNKLKHLPIKVSTLARGIAFGHELEYADSVTLGRSLTQRTPFQINP